MRITCQLILRNVISSQLHADKRVITGCRREDINNIENDNPEWIWTITYRMPTSSPGQQRLFSVHTLPIDGPSCPWIYTGPAVVQRKTPDELCFIQQLTAFDGVALSPPCHPLKLRFSDVWQPMCREQPAALDEVHVFDEDLHLKCHQWVEVDGQRFRCPALPFTVKLRNVTARTAMQVNAHDHGAVRPFFNPELQLHLLDTVDYSAWNRTVSTPSARWFGKTWFDSATGWVGQAFKTVTNPVVSIFQVSYGFLEGVWTAITGFAVFKFFKKSLKWLSVLLAATPILGGLLFFWKKKKARPAYYDEELATAPPLPIEMRSRRRRSFREVPRYY